MTRREKPETVINIMTTVCKVDDGNSGEKGRNKYPSRRPTRGRQQHIDDDNITGRYFGANSNARTDIKINK